MPRRYPHLILVLLIVVLSTGAATAQLSLTTTFANNNGQAGNMFDVVALNTVTILGFDLNLDTGSWDIEVYAVTAGGTWQGHETDPTAWTLLGTSIGVVSAGPGNPTPLPLTLTHAIAPGATQGFYVTSSSGSAMNYTTGTSLGAISAQDTNLQILEGAGKSYPFLTTYTPRIWNGTVHYVADGLLANFSADVTLGNAPLTVNFTDQSFSSDPGGVSLHEWDFDNDGTIDSTAANPTHTYAFGGTYSVSLTVHDATHPSHTFVRTDYITVDPPLLVATSTGAGDLTLTGPPDPTGTNQGYLLLSENTPPVQGSGWLFGINPDATTFAILALPAIPGGLLHYTPVPGVFPNAPFILPPGALNLPGVTFDFVLIQVVAANDLRISNVARVTL